MRTLRHNTPGFSTSLSSLKRSAEPHPQVRKTVQDVIDAIRTEGNSALLEFTERFGGPRLTAKQLRLSGKPKVDGDTKQAISTAHANVLAFARKSLRENWTMKNAQGGLVGERFDAFRRVGIYVPGRHRAARLDRGDDGDARRRRRGAGDRGHHALRRRGPRQ
ncbi:MAG: histidinol dehydrogenase [Chthoniobacter sp.]